MNDKTTFPISIATAIAIQSICGFDPEGLPLPSGPVIRKYPILLLNIRTLIRNFIGSQPSDLRQQLNYRDVVYGVVSDIKIMTEVLTKYTNGLRVIPYVCLYKNLNLNYPIGVIKHPNTTIQRLSTLMVDNTIHSLISNPLDIELRVFNNDFDNPVSFINQPLQTEALILTHLPLDLLGNRFFRSLTLLESHTGKLKTSVEWNTKLKNFKPEFKRIPFNKLTVQLFGETGDVFQPILTPKLKQDLSIISEEFKWDTTTSIERMVNCIKIKNNVEILKLIKN
jgi:hypothetical protein